MRGKSGNSPFLPGGLDDIVKAGDVRGKVSSSGIGNTAERHKNWLTVAPGLSRGLRLPQNVERDGEIVEDSNVHDDVLSSEALDLSQLATVCFLFTVENLKNGRTHASFFFLYQLSSPVPNEARRQEVPAANGDIDDLLPSSVCLLYLLHSHLILFVREPTSHHRLTLVFCAPRSSNIFKNAIGHMLLISRGLYLNMTF